MHWHPGLQLAASAQAQGLQQRVQLWVAGRMGRAQPRYLAGLWAGQRSQPCQALQAEDMGAGELLGCLEDVVIAEADGALQRRPLSLSLGCFGDLGLLAELGDLGTVAVGLLLLVGGMVMCHTCGLDDMVLGCGTMETTVSDLDCSFPARCSQSLSPHPSSFYHLRDAWGHLCEIPHPFPHLKVLLLKLYPSAPQLSCCPGVSTLGCPSLAGPCGHCSSEPLPPALAYLTVPLGRNKSDDDNGPQQLLFTSGLFWAGLWSCDQEPRCRRVALGGPRVSQEECGSGPGEIGLNTDPSGGLAIWWGTTGRQLCEGGAPATLTGCETRGLKQNSWPWPEKGLCFPTMALNLQGPLIWLVTRAWCWPSGPGNAPHFGQWSGEGG